MSPTKLAVKSKASRECNPPKGKISATALLANSSCSRACNSVSGEISATRLCEKRSFANWSSAANGARSSDGVFREIEYLQSAEIRQRRQVLYLVYLEPQFAEIDQTAQRRDIHNGIVIEG